MKKQFLAIISMCSIFTISTEHLQAGLMTSIKQCFVSTGAQAANLTHRGTDAVKRYLSSPGIQAALLQSPKMSGHLFRYSYITALVGINAGIVYYFYTACKKAHKGDVVVQGTLNGVANQPIQLTRIRVEQEAQNPTAPNTQNIKDAEAWYRSKRKREKLAYLSATICLKFLSEASLPLATQGLKNAILWGHITGGPSAAERMAWNGALWALKAIDLYHLVGLPVALGLACSRGSGHTGVKGSIVNKDFAIGCGVPAFMSASLAGMRVPENRGYIGSLYQFCRQYIKK